MEVRIGVTHASRELTLETSASVDEIRKLVAEALSSEDGLFTFTDDRGRTVCVPAAKLGYIEMAGEASRRMGFATR